MGLGYKKPELDVPHSQTVRYYPATRGLSRKIQHYISGRFTKEYINFLGECITPWHTITTIVDEAKKAGFQSRFSKKKPYIRVHGEETTMALIKPGRKPITEGLRIVYSHSDRVGLVLKPNPMLFEWDPELKEMHTGVRLDTVPYGGIDMEDFAAKNVEVVGWTQKPNGKKREIRFDGYTPKISVHTAEEKENDDSVEDVDVITGHESKVAMLKSLGFKGEEDFGRSRLYVIPKEGVVRMPNNFVSALGHDDISCTYAGLKAIKEADPLYTSIFFAFDKEEVSGPGVSGTKAIFLEQILTELAHHSGNSSNWDLMQMISNSLAINADVDVGSNFSEVDTVDQQSVAKFAYGVFINTAVGGYDCNPSSTEYTNWLINLVHDKKLRAQTIGAPLKAYCADEHATAGSDFSNKGIPTADVGTPVGGLHRVELLHMGDLYWTYRMYKEFYDSRKKSPLMIKP